MIVEDIMQDLLICLFTIIGIFKLKVTSISKLSPILLFAHLPETLEDF